MAQPDRAYPSSVTEALAKARALTPQERAKVLMNLEEEAERLRPSSKDALIHTLAVLIAEAEIVIRGLQESHQEGGEQPLPPSDQTAL